MWIASLLLAQDLFDREFESRLPTCLEYKQSARASVSASLDFGGLACNGFDLGASFRAQFDRQIGEDFLKGMQSDLASNALVLACQASPTLCDAMKHYRLTASALLSIQQGQCQSLERAGAGVGHEIVASSALGCLREKQKEGKTLDQALAACLQAESVRDLSGQESRELDVLKEIGRFLKLDDELKKLLEEIGQPIKLGGSNVSVELNLGGIAKIFNRRREEREAAWREAVAQQKALPGLRDVDSATISRMPEQRREAVIRSLATSKTFLDLSHQLEELDQVIQALEASPTTEKLAPLLAKEREWIRAEVRRLEEAYRRQALYNDGIARTMSVLDEELDRQFGARVQHLRDEAVTKRVMAETRPWGDGARSEPPKGAGCAADCGKTDYSIGNVRGR